MIEEALGSFRAQHLCLGKFEIMVAFASAYWGSSIFGELQYFL
jgi:hypothetical protein